MHRTNAVRPVIFTPLGLPNCRKAGMLSTGYKLRLLIDVDHYEAHMAEQPPLLGELAKRLGDILPEILPGKPLAEDLEKSAKAVAQTVFNRLELVTRDEYDTQVDLLHRTQERVIQLEQQLEQLTTALDTLESGNTDPS